MNGKPTFENADPILNLGYCRPTKEPRRQLIRTESMPSKNTQGEATIHEESEEPMEIHAECEAKEGDCCKGCDEKRVLIDSLVEEGETLKIERYKLKIGVDELSVKLNKAKHEERSFS